jgi:hypothetical protein
MRPHGVSSVEARGKRGCRSRLRRTALMLLLTSPGGMLTACVGDQTGPLSYERVVQLSVSTLEQIGDRSFLVVGDTGEAWVDIHSDFDPHPRDLEFRSSDPSVVAVGPVAANNSAKLIGRAPGMVRITARALGMVTPPEIVEVTATPLPVDSLHLWLAAVSRDVPAEYDARGNLAQLTLPVGGSAALAVVVFRAGLRFGRIVFSLASSNPSVARTVSGCRPPELEPVCGITCELGHWRSPGRSSDHGHGAQRAGVVSGEGALALGSDRCELGGTMPWPVRLVGHRALRRDLGAVTEFGRISSRDRCRYKLQSRRRR